MVLVIVNLMRMRVMRIVRMAFMNFMVARGGERRACKHHHEQDSREKLLHGLNPSMNPIARRRAPVTQVPKEQPGDLSGQRGPKRTFRRDVGDGDDGGDDGPRLRTMGLQTPSTTELLQVPSSWVESYHGLDFRRPTVATSSLQNATKVGSRGAAVRFCAC